MNYIPAASSETGSYLCTWDRQGYVASKYKFSGGANVRDALTPEYLFGDEENYHWLPREYRSGLFFLLDDGWDTPPRRGAAVYRSRAGVCRRHYESRR